MEKTIVRMFLSIIVGLFTMMIFKFVFEASDFTIGLYTGIFATMTWYIVREEEAK